MQPLHALNAMGLMNEGGAHCQCHSGVSRWVRKRVGMILLLRKQTSVTVSTAFRSQVPYLVPWISGSHNSADTSRKQNSHKSLQCEPLLTHTV